jgi:hypothetical protein
MASTLPKLEIGKYKGNDSTLIQRCRTVVEHINKYKAQFIAFDVLFDSWYPLRCCFRATRATRIPCICIPAK